jgi:membrane protein YqaA with SNARE-associated domain
LASNSGSVETALAASAPSPSWIVFVSGRAGILLSFLWGFAEGTFFFVVPDVLLSLVAVVAPKRVWRHILAAVLGAVCAGALMYVWATKNPAQANRIVAKVPFISQGMFDKVRTGFQRRGIAALFLGPLSGIPYKIYAIEAPGRFTLSEFAAATAPARAWRFILVCLFAGAAASLLRQKWHKTRRQLATIHGVAWILFYAFYWGRIVLQ